MSQKYSVEMLSQMSQDEFVAVLGEIFEHSPTIAAKAWEQRPFATLEELSQGMFNIVKGFSIDEQLDLIRVHPNLGSRAKMAEASVQEQAGLGLDRLTPEEFDRFQALNQAYRAKFGFPFIVAVKNHTKDSILANFEQRLEHSVDTERQQALHEIFQIAQFRLNSIVN